MKTSLRESLSVNCVRGDLSVKLFLKITLRTFIPVKLWSIITTVDSHSHSISDSRPCKCKTCGKSFKLQNALRDHERSVHIEERPNACSYCDKGFKLVHHLKEHILRMHEKPKERKFACTLCEKKFFNHHDLNVHEKRSHGKVWPCSEQGSERNETNKIE